MASPQTEDGYTRLANELFDVLPLARFSASQFSIVLFIIRRSYGWQRKMTGPMRLDDFRRELGIPLSSVHWAVQSLVADRVIRQNEDLSWSLNKDYEAWISNGLEIVSNGLEGNSNGLKSGIQPIGIFRAPYKVLKERLKKRKKAGSPSAGSKRQKCASPGCGVFAEPGRSKCQLCQQEAA